LAEAIRRISRFLENYRKKHNTNNIGAKAWNSQKLRS
jgi:hypothetical protein